MQRPQNDRDEVDRAHFPSQKETDAMNELRSRTLVISTGNVALTVIIDH